MAPGLCRIRAEGTMLEFDLGAWLRAVDRVLRDAADAALGVAPADDDNGDEATANGDADRTSIDASALDDEIPGSDDFAIGFDEAADDWQVDETPFEDETCEATPLDGSAADEASFDESDPEASDLEANDVDEAFVDEAFVDGALVDGAFDDDTPPGLRAAGSRSRHATGEPA